MKIIINDELCNHIEALQYEVESRKDVIVNVLAGAIHVSGDLFEKYQDEYRKFFIEYNKAKQDMLDEYKVPANVGWNLDFRTKELVLEA